MRNQLRRLACLILVFFSGMTGMVLPLSAQTAKLSIASQHAQIQEAMARRTYQVAIRLLDELKKAEPELYQLNNYEYLRARLADWTGDGATAIQLYRTVAEQKSKLSPFAMRHLAELQHERKDFKNEQVYWQLLRTSYPNSPAAKGTLGKLAESYEHSGNYRAAASVYQNISTTDREILGKTALALRKADKADAARLIFQRLLQTGKDDQGLLAAENLDELGGETLTETDHLARGRLFLKNRHAEGAIRHFQTIVRQYPACKQMPEVLFGIGRAHYISERWDEAITWYDRAHREFPKTPEGELAFYQLGHAHQNAGRTREAVAQYEAFIAEYPKSETLGGAHLNAIDTLRLAGDTTAALDWCSRTQTRLSTEVAGVTAQFLRAKILMNLNQFQAALNVLNGLQNEPLGRRAPGSTNRGEVSFLRGYCLEQLKQYSPAIDVYLGLPDERNQYYGQRATERLMNLRATLKGNAANEFTRRLTALLTTARTASTAGRYGEAKYAAHQALRLTSDPATERELFRMLETCYRNLPDYARAWKYQLVPVGRNVITSASNSPTQRDLGDELCFLGLFDEGISELPAPRVKAGGNDNWNYSLAVYANRGNRAWQAIDYAERVFGSLPADFRLELMPRDVAELLYPAPYRPAMLKATRPRQVDPRLLLAIARQESRFRPWVKSAAAARGLFQFIDSTADQIATQLKLDAYSRDDLYEPKYAVLFGAQYVSNLFKQFPGHPQAVVASYNGGEAGVRRWLQRAGSDDVDRFTPEVGFAETKDYVFIVMNNYAAYRQLYQRDLTEPEASQSASTIPQPQDEATSSNLHDLALALVEGGARALLREQ